MYTTFCVKKLEAYFTPMLPHIKREDSDKIPHLQDRVRFLADGFT